MEKMDRNQKLSITVQDKAYFHSDTHINLVSTDVCFLMSGPLTKVRIDRPTDRPTDPVFLKRN